MRILRWCLCLALTLVSSAAAVAEGVDALLDALQSPEAEVRAEAFQNAGPLGAVAVVPLAELMGHENPEVVLAAERALERIVVHAGRPGAEAEARAVAGELLRLLGDEQRTAVRSKALEHLSLAAGDDDVAAIVPLLDNPEFAGDARFALQRIPGQRATRALSEVLGRAAPELQLEIIRALGARGDAAAVPALRAVAEEPGEPQAEALQALALLGVAPSSVVEPPGPNADPEFCAAYGRALLTSAERALEANRLADAERMYLDVIALTGLNGLAQDAPDAFSAMAHLYAGALEGLAVAESSDAFNHAVSALGHAGTRDTAVRLLAGLPDPDVNPRLERVFHEAVDAPAIQSGVLYALDARQAPQLDTLLEAARASASSEVRVAAAHVAGAAASPGDLVAQATGGARWMRVLAANQYLAQAAALASAGDRDAARARYTTAAAQPFPVEQRLAALDGLAATAGADSLPFALRLLEGAPVPYPLAEAQGAAPAIVDLDALTGHSEFLAAAQRAYIGALAATSDQGAARSALLEIAMTAPNNAVASYAAARLADTGGDPTEPGRRRGFLTRWRLLGPFPAGTATWYGSEFMDLDADLRVDQVSWKGEIFTWQTETVHRLPSVVRLHERFGPLNGAVVYGHARVVVEETTPAAFLLGSNDGYEFWLNGERMRGFEGGRGLRVDEDRIEGTLAPGANDILIKVMNQGGAWEFCVRLTSPDGAPLVVSEAGALGP